MKLLLANMELYQAWVDRGAAKFSGFNEEAYEQSAMSDMGEYHLAGTDAVIQVTGPLSYKYDFWSWLMGGTSYQGIMAQLQAAEANGDVRRVVLLMDTPGGEVTGVVEAGRAIKNCSKPVVALVDPCCASAGLWLASQANRIVSVESGEIGSLGVQCMAVSYAKMFEESGLDVRLVRAAISPDKNLAHPYEPLGDKAMEYLQDRVDRAGVRFVEAVASGRSVSTEDVLAKFGQGKMLESAEAIDVGLIDEIGTLGSLLAESRDGGMRKNKRRATLQRARAYRRF
jgi:signal peptide peptidase SppA